MAKISNIIVNKANFNEDYREWMTRRNHITVNFIWLHTDFEIITSIFKYVRLKTTLLMRFIEFITRDNKFHVKNFNLREILISNYKDFVRAFFEIDFEKSKDEIKEKREYNLKLFKLTTEILKIKNMTLLLFWKLSF